MYFPRSNPGVACWSDGMVYLKADGTLWAIGNNTNGRFGVPSSTTPKFTKWTKLSLDDARAVFAIYDGLYVTRNDGSTWFCGFKAGDYATGEYDDSDENKYNGTFRQFPKDNVALVGENPTASCTKNPNNKWYWIYDGYNPKNCIFVTTDEGDVWFNTYEDTCLARSIDNTSATAGAHTRYYYTVGSYSWLFSHSTDENTNTSFGITQNASLGLTTRAMSNAKLKLYRYKYLKQLQAYFVTAQFSYNETWHRGNNGTAYNDGRHEYHMHPVPLLVFSDGTMIGKGPTYPYTSYNTYSGSVRATAQTSIMVWKQSIPGIQSGTGAYDEFNFFKNNQDNFDKSYYTFKNIEQIHVGSCGNWAHSNDSSVGVTVLYKDGTLKEFHSSYSTTNHSYDNGYASGTGKIWADTKSMEPTVLDIDNVKMFHKPLIPGEVSSMSTWFLKNDGTVWVCGKNQYGQLCTGNTSDVITISKSLIDGVDYICGPKHSNNYIVFLKKDGTILTI